MAVLMTLDEFTSPGLDGRNLLAKGLAQPAARVRRSDQEWGRPAEDLFRGRAAESAEALVGPFDPALSIGDDDRVGGRAARRSPGGASELRSWARPKATLIRVATSQM